MNVLISDVKCHCGIACSSFRLRNFFFNWDTLFLLFQAASIRKDPDLFSYSINLQKNRVRVRYYYCCSGFFPHWFIWKRDDIVYESYPILWFWMEKKKKITTKSSVYTCSHTQKKLQEKKELIKENRRKNNAHLISYKFYLFRMYLYIY